MSTIKALTADRILVRLDVGAQTSPSGLIIIPPSAQKLESYGTVELIGPEVKYVKPGQKVLTDEHAGITIEEDSNSRLVLYTESDIQGILE